MPSWNHRWNEITNFGNLTKLQSVIDMINWVKKFEACKQGASLKAKCLLRAGKFRAVFSEFRDANANMIDKNRMPAVIEFTLLIVWMIVVNRNNPISTLWQISKHCIGGKTLLGKECTWKMRYPMATYIWMSGCSILMVGSCWVVARSVPFLPYLVLISLPLCLHSVIR